MNKQIKELVSEEDDVATLEIKAEEFDNWCKESDDGADDRVKCKTHPDAPHSFLRNSSHSAGRYVCQCEHWEEPE